MKLIITGAMGHIGSALAPLMADSASEYGLNKIILIDNFSTQRFCSRFELAKYPLVETREEDVAKCDLTQLLNKGDFVVHLAAVTDAAGSFENAEFVEKNNFQSTKNIAETCAEREANLIHISSTSVYGSAKAIVDEECGEDELMPQSPYATTKLREEKLLNELRLTRGLNFQICRFGTIYGYSIGMRFHTAVNKFCWQASLKQPITVWETAYDQKRPYLSLIDACAFIGTIVESRTVTNDVINVLTENHTVRNVVDILRVYVPTLRVEFVKSKIMNQLSYEVSNKKMLSRGFRLRGDLNRGIAQTLAMLGVATSPR